MPSAIRPLAYRAFARAVGANLDETELALGAYRSFGEFFTRRLRDGARAVDGARGAIVSPCDGVVAARGVAVDGTLIQAKGRNYELSDLLADEALSGRLTGGAYVTIYLSPRDYHRVHAPVAARIDECCFVPGALWPVNPRVASRVDGLLARNERVVIHLNSEELGHVALVMVGAAGVGNITVSALRASGVSAPGASGVSALRASGVSEKVLASAELRPRGELYRVELGGVAVERGDELGAFQLGSTVVMIFEPGRAVLAGDVGDTVRFGQRIGGVA